MLSPEQSRAARAWLDWSQGELAKRASVALSTVRDFEKGRRIPIKNNLDAIQNALESAGAKLIFDGDQPVGVEIRGRISERDLIRPALEYLDQTDEGFMKTSDLIAALELLFRPTGEDAAILESRSDTKFSQIVRNIVSHRTSPTNLIGAGYATYDRKRRGLVITDLGRQYLLAREQPI